ncbi:unnamed protein product, partial [Hymenolepis diminuta]
KQSCGLKNALLEKQIVSLSEELEKAKIIKLIKEDAMMGSYEIEKVFSTKDRQIKELHFELARACKAYSDLLWTFKQTMQNYGIKTENLDFNVARNVLINGGKLEFGKEIIPGPPG